ncbi:MAG: hypothetical protein AAF653_09505 [Chloroflexota bacterium]
MKRTHSTFAQNIIRSLLIALLLFALAACQSDASSEPAQTEDVVVTPEATEDVTPEADDTTPEATDNVTPEADDGTPEATDNVTPEADNSTPEVNAGTPEVVDNVTPEPGEVIVQTNVDPELAGGIPNSETPDGQYSFSVISLNELEDGENMYLLDASITNQSGPEITIDGEAVVIVDEEGNRYGPVEMAERIQPPLNGTTLSETEGVRGFAQYEIPPDAVLSHAEWCPDEACEQVAGSAIP